jgi:hypothetical protein
MLLRVLHGPRLRRSSFRLDPPVLFAAAVFAVATPAVVSPGPAQDLSDTILRSPCSTQARLFEKMADDVTLPDAIIAAACRRRADIAFASENYTTACRYYKRAAAFDDAPGKCCILAARAAGAAGDRAAENGLLQSVADDGEGDARNEARVALAGEAIRRDDYRGALSLLRKVPFTAPDKSFEVPALLARLVCGRKLGMTDSLQAFESPLRPYAGTMLERDRAGELGLVAGSARPSGSAGEPSLRSAKLVPGEKDDAPEYLVRIGPFKTKRQALALKKKLVRLAEKSHLHFAVTKKRSGFLLAISGFDSLESAERFGRERVKGQEIAYRIIER